MSDTLQRINRLNLLRDNQNDLEKVFEEIQEKKKVLFYFHGGLSYDSYVRKKLGPYLLRTMFSKQALGEDTHVVFMQYNSGILQFKSITGLVKRILKSHIFSEILSFMQGQVFVQGQKIKNKALSKNISADDYEDFLEKELHRYTRGELLDGFYDYDYTKDISTKNLKYKSSLRKNSKKYLKWLFVKLLGRLKIYGAFINFATRVLVLETNHKDVTLIEEFSKVSIFKLISKYARNHWENIVHNNAEKMWTNNLGEEFLEKLKVLHETRKNNNNPISINLVSHSAGSIPISFLIENLKENNSVIDNILLIVPAVKFKVFEDKIKANSNVFKAIKIYLLGNEEEEKDLITEYKIIKNLYRSSLLYFVSGIAEKGDGLSDMTILGMHRYYKNHKTYDKYNGTNDERFGNVQACKDYLTEAGEERMAFVLNGNCAEDDYLNQQIIITGNGATHSGTKKPHESPELAVDIVKVLTGSTIEPNISAWSQAAIDCKVDN